MLNEFWKMQSGIINLILEQIFRIKIGMLQWNAHKKTVKLG